MNTHNAYHETEHMCINMNTCKYASVQDVEHTGVLQTTHKSEHIHMYMNCVCLCTPCERLRPWSMDVQINHSVCVEGNSTTWRVYLAVLQSVPQSL